MTNQDTYPHLFQPGDWGGISARFEQTDVLPPAHTIANISVVPFIGDRIVMIHTQAGYYDFPGGTLEPDETYRQTIERELLEEAGARLIPDTLRLIGNWQCHSSHPKPYRAHLPHPDFVRLAAFAEVELVQQPSNPDGGEQVIDVLTLPVDEAFQRFEQEGRPELAELCYLAAALHAQTR